MKRLKLHHQSNLNIFIDGCIAAILKSPLSKLDWEIRRDVYDEATRLGLRGIWRYFSGNRFLWEDGYSIFLAAEIKATFKHYRALDAKAQEKQLTRKIKENK